MLHTDQCRRTRHLPGLNVEPFPVLTGIEKATISDGSFKHAALRDMQAAVHTEIYALDIATTWLEYADRVLRNLEEESAQSVSLLLSTLAKTAG
jgi:hypothetical protein